MLQVQLFPLKPLPEDPPESKSLFFFAQIRTLSLLPFPSEEVQWPSEEENQDNEVNR